MRALLFAAALSLVACSSPPPESESESPAASPPPGPSPEAEPAVAEVESALAKAEPAEPVPPAWTPKPEDLVEPHHPIEDPEALEYFFEQLAALDDGQDKVVRVEHLGASMIGMDDLPSIMRGKFQERFGDGGAGLVLLQRYMSNYIHR